MALCKATLFFRDEKLGWSEVYYLLSQQDDPAAAKIVAKELCLRRANLLAPGIRLERCRLSLEATDPSAPPPRAYTLGEVPLPFVLDGVPYYNQSFVAGGVFLDDVNPERPYSVFLVEGDTIGGKYHKRLYLAGFRRVDLTDPDLLLTTAIFDTAFDSWKTVVTDTGGGPWGFKVTDKDAAQHAITTVVFAGGVLTVTGPDDAPADGKRVQIVGVKGEGTRVDGVWTARAVVGNAKAFTLQGYPGPFTYSHGGAWRLVGYKVVQPETLAVTGEAHRKRGKGFGVPRGRSRTGQTAR